MFYGAAVDSFHHPLNVESDGFHYSVDLLITCQILRIDDGRERSDSIIDRRSKGKPIKVVSIAEIRSVALRPIVGLDSESPITINHAESGADELVRRPSVKGTIGLHFENSDK